MRNMWNFPDKVCVTNWLQSQKEENIGFMEIFGFQFLVNVLNLGCLEYELINFWTDVCMPLF